MQRRQTWKAGKWLLRVEGGSGITAGLEGSFENSGNVLKLPCCIVVQL